MSRIAFGEFLSLGALVVINPSLQIRGIKQSPHNRAAIRVVDSKGKGVPGARVLFVGKRSPFEFFPDWGKQMEMRTDKRGIARAELTSTLGWMVWACLDRGRKRFASKAILIEPGGKAQLRLRRFPVPFVRLVGLEAWRKIYGDQLRIEWSSLPYYLPDGIRAHFSRDIPKGPDPILKIPPLPWDTYYPLLIHKKEGTLGFMYLGPSFSNAPTSQSLYERDYPLKRFPLGTPISIQGKAVDPRGTPIPGARVILLSTNGAIPHREVQTDNKGLFHFYLAKPEPHVGTYSFMILHPHFQPFITSSSALLKGQQKKTNTTKEKRLQLVNPAKVFSLKWGKNGTGQIKGAGGGTLYISSLWGDPTRGKSVTAWLPFHLDPEGSFGFPTSQVSLQSTLLMHPKYGAILLPPPSLSQLRKGWKIDLTDQRRVSIDCIRGDGNHVGRARIAILLRRRGRSTFPLFFSTPPKGPLTLKLFPGTYALFAHRKHQGFAKLSIEIEKGPLTRMIHLNLKEGITIRGSLNTPTGTPISQGMIHPMSIYGRHGSWTEGGVLSLLIQKAYSDSQGGFSLEIPADCPSLSLEANVFFKQTIYSGSSLWKGPGSPPPKILITLPKK